MKRALIIGTALAVLAALAWALWPADDGPTQGLASIGDGAPGG